MLLTELSCTDVSGRAGAPLRVHPACYTCGKGHTPPDLFLHPPSLSSVDENVINKRANDVCYSDDYASEGER